MRRPHPTLYFLSLPIFILFTLSAEVTAQVVPPISLPRGNPYPHPPSQPISGPRHETGWPRRTTAPNLPPYSRSEMKARARDMLKLADKAYRSTPPLYEYAMDTYREAAKLNPKDERGYVGLGNVYSSLKRYDIAALMYARAAEIKPKSAEARYGLGAAYFAQGKKDAALNELQLLRSLKKKKLADKLEALMAR